MSKRSASKYKIDRRLGVNLWGRPKSPYNKREYGPGEHGQRRFKISDYGLQFRRYYADAVRHRGDTGEILIGLLESRLDAAVYRLKFAPTVFGARQLVNHGHVRVNGKRVTIPSYRLKEGDEIELREKAREIPMVLEAAELPERDVPDYYNVDYNKMTGTFLRVPLLAEVPYPVQMEPNLVIEYYSR